MFVDNIVVKEFDGERSYDKFALASALLQVSFNGATCSLLEGQVLDSCDHCQRRYLCRKIDELVKDYTDKTTVVKANFTFE